jgi:uncharacterized protein YjbI with pentapeptide repeats
MKIIKPLRLGMLTRPFMRDERHWLAVTVIAMTDSLGKDARLVPEPECWQTFGAEFGIEAPFDLAMPKAQPEFIVSGEAYTRHQQDKTQCAVRVRMGRRQKDLLVFGDRFWVDGRATAPQPFESLRIDWRHAFGGPDFPENPIGIGREDELVNGLKVRRLPNVEDPAARLQRADQVPGPAGLGPVDIGRPSRADRLGRQYDEDWSQHLFPGFAEDMDWRYFNAAPPDQWLAPEDGELPGTDFEIWNMHPDKEVLRGRVPDWRARCVVVRGPINSLSLDEGTLDDMPMRLTTAWFFPRLERMGLIYHGFLPVQEDDAADITHAMIAMEDGALPPQGLDAWREVLALRCESEDRALYGMRDDLLLPEPIIGPWPEIDEAFEGSPLRQNMKARAEHERGKMRVAFKASGLGAADEAPAEPPAPPDVETIPTMKELPAYMRRRKAVIEEEKQKMEAARKEMDDAARANAENSRKAGFDTSQFPAKVDSDRPKGPPKVDFWPRVESMARDARASGYAPSPEEMAQLRAVHDDATRRLLESYRETAQHQDAADKLSPEASAALRAQIAQRLAEARDLSEMDLTGADLSGMDLRNVRWQRALLECADLSGSVLDGGDFREAVLVRARFSGTSMRDANLTDANLALATCDNASFAGARFDATDLEEFTARGCDFSDAFLDTGEVSKVTLENCRFDRAQLLNLSFSEGSRLHASSFADARLHKVTWVECQVGGLRFPGAMLDTCDWTDTDCTDGVDFSDAHLIATCFVGSSRLHKANFQGATLVDCNLRETMLDEADFRDAKVDNTDFTDASMRGANLAGASADGAEFVRTDLTAASLMDVSLIDADLRKAILVATDFRGANLFQADLSQCLIDEATRFDEAYTEQVVTVPRRKVQEGAR